MGVNGKVLLLTSLIQTDETSMKLNPHHLKKIKSVLIIYAVKKIECSGRATNIPSTEVYMH